MFVTELGINQIERAHVKKAPITPGIQCQVWLQASDWHEPCRGSIFSPIGTVGRWFKEFYIEKQHTHLTCLPELRLCDYLACPKKMANGNKIRKKGGRDCKSSRGHSAPRKCLHRRSGGNQSPPRTALDPTISTSQSQSRATLLFPGGVD